MIRIETCDLIALNEGFVSYPYKDIAGVPTIGYGSTYYLSGRPVSMADKTIDEKTAFEMMAKNAETHYWAALKAAIKVELPDYFLQGALISWCYNVGINAMRKSTVIKLINAGKFDEALAALTAWQYFTNPKTGKKEVSPALARRHKREQIFGRLDSSRPYTRAEIQSILRIV